ncbi:uncharacterized protein EV420DRAFT_1306399 [Desarmillaria tabescens]|uniref:NADH:flavin oxidoreductase/NADH oxidase N-terminal domain-containing protein n=1 Tax=Armillaria tabescens TaxID=1929756 RepID=A0AA39N7L1_ARMTA|nr:uncharacterized protein EV420DRAFT_1306399 [Desarmillaria tabescens]KAK0460503.1 hypothetical protein EV420DRAFT_1306399 [Desarmillaria tabescens]
MSSKLFQPVKVGNLTLSHRIVMAPLTRYRATQKTRVPHVSVVKEYYSQRASDPGTLLISEAVWIAQKAVGRDYNPGVWSREQLDAWKEITDAVHAKGSFIFCQIWSLGRAADITSLREENPPLPYTAPSPIRLTGKEETPRELTAEEIREYVRMYAEGASKAVYEGGFDGVEIHGANGYQIDQFIQDVSNQRTDEYGGSIENRVRFALQVIDAVVEVVGAERTGFRVSPWAPNIVSYVYPDMGMEDPVPTFSHLILKIRERHPNLAYIHVVEPRISGPFTRDEVPPGESNDFIREIWAPRPLISAGAYTRESAMETADTKGDIIAFGRYFISNPDITLRLKHRIPLSPYDRPTFYIRGDTSGKGYTDYAVAVAQ